MRIINLIQNTPDWYEWRKGGVGASEANIILGARTYNTPLGLWAEKLGIVAKAPVHPKAAEAQAKGHELEPVALALINKQIGIQLAPACVEHDHVAHLRASLDGLDQVRGLSAEIKVPGKTTHQYAVDGRVPPKYIAQLQYQMMVTGHPNMLYGSYFEKALITVFLARDEAYITTLRAEVDRFWDCVVFWDPPPAIEADYKKLVKTLIANKQGVKSE